MLRFQKRSEQALSGSRANVNADSDAASVASNINTQTDAATNTRSSWLPEQPVESDSDAKEKISAD